MAAEFKNSYISFEAPDGWKCELEETEWVCAPPIGDTNYKRMIIILAAKEVNRLDSPQAYMRHLEHRATDPKVKLLQSPTYRIVKRRLWLDTVLENSEIQGLVTRYLARTEGDIGVVVTYSSTKDTTAQAQQYSDRMAQTLEIRSTYARAVLRKKIARDQQE